MKLSSLSWWLPVNSRNTTQDEIGQTTIFIFIMQNFVKHQH